MPLTSFPAGYRAVVIGASGAIGAALVAQLRADPACSLVLGLHRRSVPAIDFDADGSVATAAAAVASEGPFHLDINAAGVLHKPQFMPEKKLADLNEAQLLATLRANTIGPALVLRHFAPLRAAARCAARRAGGAVGQGRQHRGQPPGRLVQLPGFESGAEHAAQDCGDRAQTRPAAGGAGGAAPGTVRSALSQPFRGDQIGRPAAQAAAELLAVVDGLTPADTGRFMAYDGAPLPW